MCYNFNDYRPFGAHYWNWFAVTNTFFIYLLPQNTELPIGIYLLLGIFYVLQSLYLCTLTRACTKIPKPFAHPSLPKALVASNTYVITIMHTSLCRG